MEANHSINNKEFLFIGITMPSPVEGESGRITRFLRGNLLDIMHIRHPESSANEIERIIREIPPDLHHRLTLHDHFRLAEHLGIGGIHLNGRNPDIPEDLIKKRPDLRISRSCHSIEEVTEARNLDYVTLSPVFDSISKEGYKSIIPKDKLPLLKNRLKEARVPVVALGGVTPEKESLLRLIGFAGMALLGSLWKERNL